MSATEPDPELLAAAQAIHLLAYCPYSHYRVGAAIRTGAGAVVVGCNVENAAYPLGSCAEAGAIAAMVAGAEHSIAEIVVVTDGDEPGTPCGGCRHGGDLDDHGGRTAPSFVRAGAPRNRERTTNLSHIDSTNLTPTLAPDSVAPIV